jgi:hypothetical protein
LTLTLGAGLASNKSETVLGGTLYAISSWESNKNGVLVSISKQVIVAKSCRVIMTFGFIYSKVATIW